MVLRFIYRVEHGSIRFARTLLFICPDCNLPIATSRVAEQRNLEPLDAETFKIKCGYCGAVCDLLGVAASMHWVRLGGTVT
jgi:hypothetical protein